MQFSRRTLLGGATLAGVSGFVSRAGSAVADGTPIATPASPGFAIARVRALPTADLNQAVYPHVMHRYLPAIEAVSGFAGYFFAFHDNEPGTSISLNLTSDEAAAEESDAAAADFVAGLDPRFTVETPVNEQGPLRIFGFSERPASELAPFLHGYKITMRNRQTAEGADIEAVIAQAQDELLPLMAAMEGFVMYAWILTPNGRTAINIWETAEQMAAGDHAVADYVAQNSVSTTVGEPVVNNGTIGYAAV